MTDLDWENEGFLEKLDGEAREARIRLLGDLHKDGVSVEELRQAIAEHRLMFLPVERALGEEPIYSALDIAEKSGLDYEFLTSQWQALGLPTTDPDAIAYGERDLEASRKVKLFLDAGLPSDGIIDMGRVLGQAMSRVAEASRFLLASSFLDPDASEYEVAQQARIATPMADLMEQTLGYVYRQQLVEQLRHEVAARSDLPTGQREVTFGFADLVGWTELGEADEDRIGAVADRLSAMTTDMLRPPVRVVKMIGDAAMLVSPDKKALVDLSLDMVDTAREDPEFPELRAGVASGLAFSRWGDWYGRPVNLASRVCSRARPGSVLVTESVMDACDEDDYRFSSAGVKNLKGIGPVPLWRVRRAQSA